MPCRYTGCKKEEEIIIMLDRPIELCREHFNKFQKVLERLALKNGASRVRDLKVKKRRGRVRLG
ncbi:MAG: hypothetical protein DRN53_03085 [Thermoprotei archaeon]|nr:MAG: hypothetical protein DRN53_03085 [Thermoprotei archaeon]